MFSGIRRAFGSVVVKQKTTEIVVEGIPADVMVRDISKIWNTSKITMNMFNSLGKHSFSFNNFFAADIVYMLGMMMQSRKAYTSVKVLANIREQIIQNSWLKSTLVDENVPGRLDFSKLANLKYTPLPHQMEYLKHYSRVVDQLQLDGYLLAAAPGAGKTLNVLQLAECMDADLIVIVCPKIAVYRVWEDTVKYTAYKTPQSYWVYASGQPYAGQRIAIVHYEGLANVLELANTGRMKGQRVCVALDESHNLNEITSLRTQLFINLSKTLQSHNTVWASGTALKALGGEMIPLLRCIDPMFTPDTEARFKKIFGKDASKALDIIKHRFGLVSFLVEKKELKLAPPIFRAQGVKIPNGDQFTLPAIRVVMEKFIAERVQYYKLRRREDEAYWAECMKLHKLALRTKQEWALFAQYEKDLAFVIRYPDPKESGEQIKATNIYEKQQFEPTLPRDMIKRFRDVKSVIKYVMLKIQGECLGRVLGRTRIECGVAMVQHVDFVGICESTQKKTVVFTSFVEALQETDKVCRASGMTPVLVYGATNNELANNVAKFEKNEQLNPLAATFQSLSTAVPLTMADTMILLNSPFRSYILEQAVSRIHRIGQDSQTVIWQMALDTGDIPNISTRSNEIMAWSMAQVEAIMGIKSPFQVEELPGFESFKDEVVFDENKTMHRLIAEPYEAFGITISEEDFKIPQAPKPKAAPAYLNW